MSVPQTEKTETMAICRGDFTIALSTMFKECSSFHKPREIREKEGKEEGKAGGGELKEIHRS